MYVSKSGGTSTYLRLLPGVLGGGVLAVVILVLGDRLQRRGLPDVKTSHGIPVLLLVPASKRKTEHPLTRAISSLFGHSALLSRIRGRRYRKILPYRRRADGPYPCRSAYFSHDSLLGTGRRHIYPRPVPYTAAAAISVAAIVSAHVHATDHYFYMFRAKSSPDLSPAQVIRAGKPGSAVVIVAASGGGSKPAAWTARVLTGLEESNPPPVW